MRARPGPPAGNNISKDTALDEKGNIVKGRGDTPNEHDILTGSRADGTCLCPADGHDVRGWTSSTDGSAIVGHHDRIGPLPGQLGQELEPATSRPAAARRRWCAPVAPGRLYCLPRTDTAPSAAC